MHAHAHTHTHTHTHTHSHTNNDCSRNWVLILVGVRILWGEDGFQVGFERWLDWPVSKTLWEWMNPVYSGAEGVLVGEKMSCCSHWSLGNGWGKQVPMKNRYVAARLLCLWCFCVILFQVKCCNPQICDPDEKCWESKGLGTHSSRRKAALAKIWRKVTNTRNESDWIVIINCHIRLSVRENTHTHTFSMKDILQWASTAKLPSWKM